MSRLLKITDLGSGIMVQGTDNVLYPDNATLTYPYNSIVVVTDESDIATFRSASNNDVLFSGLIGKIEIGGETVTKQNINTKFDAIANKESGGGGGGDVTGLFADASYDSQTKHINFYDKDNTLVAYVDATDFIKDGMVSNVEILNGNLVITFNTDAGKEPITIPLTDIFNPANYYDKTTADSTFATQTVVNEEIAARIQGDNAINTALQSKADKSDTYTKTQVDDALALKQDASTAFSGDYNDLTNKPTNVSAFTNDAGYLTEHQSLSDYYTKTETDNAIATAMEDIDLSDYVDVTTFNKKELATAKALTQLNDTKADKTEIPDVSTLATKTELNAKADASNVYTKTQTDAAIQTAVGQIDLSDYQTKEDADVKEEVISTALNNLAANKQDALTAGTGISIQNNVISATGGGGGTQQQADWNQTDTTAVDYIKNKPTIPTVPTNVSAFTNDAGYLTQHQSLSDYYTKTETDDNFALKFTDVDDIQKVSALPANPDSRTLYLIPVQ